MVFKRGALVQSMVEFEDIQTATAAKTELHGCDIYAGSCTLKVEFATTDRLNVKRNDDMTWDFTDECVLRQGFGQEEGEIQRGHGGTIGLLTTIEGKPILEIEIPQHGRDMRLRVLLQTKNGRMEALEGIGPLGKELTKSDKEITLEITHERDVEGKYTLALSVADQVLTRVNVDSQILRNLTDIKLNNYYIKNVIVLNKP